MKRFPVAIEKASKEESFKAIYLRYPELQLNIVQE